MQQGTGAGGIKKATWAELRAAGAGDGSFEVCVAG